MTKIKLTAYQADNGACYGYRLYNPLNTIQSHDENREVWDIRITVRYEPQDLEASDAIILQRQIDGSAFANAISARRRAGTRVIYETDDDLFNVPWWNPFYEHFQDAAFRQNFGFFLEECDAIFVSTEHLKKVYSRYNDQIYVLPNSIDPNFAIPRFGNNRIPVIGWAGSGTHRADFERMQPALARLAQDPDLRIRLFWYPDFSGPSVQQVPWVDWSSYYQCLALSDFDIGLAPLAEHIFNRSKSNIRYLEYAMAGTPVIASRVGPYAESIVHGKTGLFVDDDDAWEDTIRGLLRDEDLRHRLADNAKNDVLTRFNIHNNYVLWENAIRAICAREPKTTRRRFKLVPTNLEVGYMPARFLLPRAS